MRSTLALAFASLALTFAACGGSDDDSSGTIDASRIDAPPGAIDAAVDAPMATGGLGSPCTGSGQGSCPTGFVCLGLAGGTATWCSKPCSGAADTSCATGYTGPGFAACFVGTMPAPASPDRCGIICEDIPDASTICPGGAAQCNRTCPAPLACNADLTSSMGTVLARACR